MNKNVANCFFAAFLWSVFFGASSCASNKKLLYFNVLEDTVLRSFTLPTDPVIQKNDILGITVTSLSNEASSIFNVAASTNSGSGVSGYLVNSDGNIQLPVLGMVKAEGLTKNQLKANITDLLTRRKLLVDPIVNVQFNNLRIIMLGQVGRAGVISFANERMSVIEAIGQAGDLPVTARKDRILLIREENGQKIFRYLDLTSSTIFSSPYFYLKSNDVLYVEPTEAFVKSANEFRVPGWISFFMGVLSFLIGIAVLVVK